MQPVTHAVLRPRTSAWRAPAPRVRWLSPLAEAFPCSFLTGTRDCLVDRDQNLA